MCSVGGDGPLLFAVSGMELLGLFCFPRHVSTMCMLAFLIEARLTNDSCHALAQR